MLRNNTYKENIKKITNGNYSDQFLELAAEIIDLTTLREYIIMDSSNLAMMEIQFYKRVREDATKCGLSDKDVNSWIIGEAVDTDNKYHSNYTVSYPLTRDLVKLIRYSYQLPISSSDNIITNFIHKDCYEELVEMLGQKSE